MKAQTKLIPISQVQIDPNNPRSLSKEKFESLKQSIQNFPDMLNVRPLVVADGIVVGGNMRLLAMKDLGYREVPAIDVSEWNQKERDEFMIKDNVQFGAWDWDTLANEWVNVELKEWGLDVWEPQEDLDLSEFFEPKSTELEEKDEIQISFYFSKEKGREVEEALSILGENNEETLCKLLNL